MLFYEETAEKNITELVCELMPHGLRSISVIEGELISSFHGNDEAVIKIYQDGAKESIPDLDSIMQDIYCHNNLKLEEISLIEVLEDCKDTGVDANRLSKKEFDELFEEKVVCNEEWLSYNGYYDDDKYVREVLNDNKVEYFVSRYSDYEYQFQILSEYLPSSIAEATENDIVFNFNQQTMFNDLLVDESLQEEDYFDQSLKSRCVESFYKFGEVYLNVVGVIDGE